MFTDVQPGGLGNRKDREKHKLATVSGDDGKISSYK